MFDISLRKEFFVVDVDVVVVVERWSICMNKND